MENQSDEACQWSGCCEMASKHVRFGFRLFEPEITSTFHDLHLCDSHIVEIKQQFLIVTEGDLGDCQDKHQGDVTPKIKLAA